MNSKSLFLQVVVLLTSLLVTGCGSSSKEAEEPTPPTAPTQPTTPPPTQLTAPTITLVGESVIKLIQHEEYVELSATAHDSNNDPLVVTINGEVDTSTPGNYTMTYSVVDVENNRAKVSREVTVEEQVPFITTWDTREIGGSKNNQIRIITFGSGYDFNVDWGDGTISQNVTSRITHDYEVEGIYTVSITGRFPHFYMREPWRRFGVPPVDDDVNNTFEDYKFFTDNFKLLSVEQWGNYPWRTMESSFIATKNLMINATDTPNLTKVTDMSYAFSLFDIRFTGLDRKLGNLEHWDISNVESLEGIFAYNDSFNVPLGNWDTQNVVNMRSIFYKASKFNQPINNWNMSNVKYITYLFFDAEEFNQPLDNWDLSSVINMNSTFNGSIKFNQDLSMWDVSNVVDMGYMFSGVTLPSEKYDALLLAWSSQNVGQKVNFDGGNSQYTSASASAREHLIEHFKWRIADGGMADN